MNYDKFTKLASERDRLAYAFVGIVSALVRIGIETDETTKQRLRDFAHIDALMEEAAAEDACASTGE